MKTVLGAKLSASLEANNTIEDVVSMEHATDLEQGCGVVRRQIAALENRAEALANTIVALENHEGRFSPFETQMLVHCATRVDVSLPHRRLGMGLEGYQSARSAALKGLALESFKETFHKVIAYLVELYHKLVDLIKKVFNRQKMQQKELLEFYAHYTSGKRPAKEAPDEQVEGACRALSMDGKFDAARIFHNQKLVAEGLSESAYHNGLVAFAKKSLLIAEKLLDKPEEWRSVVNEITSLDVPIPKGFERQSVVGAKAVYASAPLVLGQRITFQTIEADNVRGARGAKEMLAAIDAIGHVEDSTTWTPTSNHIDDLKQLGRSGIEAQVKPIHDLLKLSEKLIDLNLFSTVQLEDAKRLLEGVVKKPPKEMETQVVEMIRGVAVGAEKLVALSTHLSQKINTSIFKGAQLYINILHAPLV